MTERPLITIIVLCHNYGQYVGGALESALAQTYEPVEVLVVDDGSTDDSLEVINRYADRVRVISHENVGVERTTNLAVGEAEGEYFALLSADDFFEPHYLEKLWAALRRSPDAAYVYCRPMLFGAREGPMRCLPFSAYFLAKRTNFVNASALTRRDDFLEAGGYAEDFGEHALEDWDFWLRMLERGKRGTYVREPLLRWRRHQEGSRNPEAGELEAQSMAFVRGRHSGLTATMDDTRGHLAYWLDVALGALDLAVGYSRFPILLRTVERGSWRRYRRWHAPKLPR